MRLSLLVLQENERAKTLYRKFGYCPDRSDGKYSYMHKTVMIPYCSLKEITALHADEIHEAVSRVVDSGWYLQGMENKRFEQEYAGYIGTKYHLYKITKGR